MKENTNIKGIVHSDIAGQNAVNTIYYGQPDEFIKCPKCGELAKLDPEVLTSLPPQRRYRCPHCGAVGTDFCYNLNIITDPNYKPWFGEAKPINPTFYTNCLVCGDKVEISMINGPTAAICEHCKDAIISIRKLKGTWHD